MNDRIKELMLEAGYAAPEIASRANLLSELIIRECAEVVKNQYSQDWGKWSNNLILEHFGIK
jgi:hypothetical protein